jgi:hypothetical protein
MKSMTNRGHDKPPVVYKVNKAEAWRILAEKLGFRKPLASRRKRWPKI